MKKVLFMQIKGNSCGGVWFVNRAVGEALIKKGYDVEILSIRNNHNNLKLEKDPKLKVSVINDKDEWETVHFSDIKYSFSKFNILKGIKQIFKKVFDEYKLRKDFKRARSYIKVNDYDYIVVTHYQLLDIIPENMLYRTIYEHHTSFEISYKHKATREMFDKYRDKIKFVWLTKSTCDVAKNKGYNNSTYLYNPVRFSSEKRADVLNNKKLVTLARISGEKRIDLMIKIVNDIFKDLKYKEWSLDIYGDGDLKDDILKMDYDKTRIKFKGIINNPYDVLINSSINLNTSLYEGFAMGILEANECGVPTISFRFGESIDEEIIQDKTGIYVEQNDIDGYKNKLMELMDNADRLEDMSVSCKEFSKNFQIDTIINNWIDLFGNLY